MNSIILHAFEKIATEASKIAKCNQRSGELSKCCSRSQWLKIIWLIAHYIILKAIVSYYNTWYSNRSWIASHWRFSKSSHFWGFKSCDAIYYFKCKSASRFEAGRLWRIIRGRRLGRLLHYGKLIVTLEKSLYTTDSLNVLGGSFQIHISVWLWKPTWRHLLKPLKPFLIIFHLHLD